MLQSSGSNTVRRGTPRASLAALGLKLKEIDLFAPIRERVHISQKSVRYSPIDKLYAIFVACLAGVRLWLSRTRHQEISRGPAALARLGIRNAARHPVRSLLTVGLLASATFLVTAVESFHKEAGGDFFKPGGGSGELGSRA